jgi:hypothetical protein
MSIPTPTQAVRHECAWCLNVAKHQRGWDCLSPNCPLHAAMPWRGRDLPKAMQPEGGTPLEDLRRTEELLKTVPPRRVTKGMIAAKCRYCLPERGRNGDCTIDDCRLHALRPMQPGGPPKRELSAARLAQCRRAARAARAARKPSERRASFQTRAVA